ncbi:MAG: hypothetical protein ACOY82_16550 [Pseudomonadota bacterium]
MDTLTAQDRDHLRILAIMHYVFAGLGVVGLGFLGLHYTMMRTFMSPEFMKHEPNPPPEAFMDLLVWFYVVFGALMILGMILNVMVAQRLKARRGRIFCMIVAGLDLLQMPLGTLLGIFTLLVLSRDSVRRTFESGGHSSVAEQADRPA